MEQQIKREVATQTATAGEASAPRKREVAAAPSRAGLSTQDLILIAVLLAAGSPGKRLALPNARVLIHQPAMEGMQGQASDIQIVADEIDRMRVWLEDTISKHSGKPVEQVRRDIERDKILTAPQAAEYGLIDQVLESRKAL